MEEYIKDPFNYSGNKFKLLSQIYPLFPKKEDIKLFIDVFGGSGCVSVNSPYTHIFCNDKLEPLTGMLKWFDNTDSDMVLREIDKTILKYDLSKTNREGYNALRELYNENAIVDALSNYESSKHLYCLLTHSFNNMIQFNSRGGLSVPFGANKSSFNSAIRERLPRYIDKIQEKKIIFCSYTFDYLITHVMQKYKHITSKVFFYLDPPYLASDDSYSRTKNNKWTKESEIKLYECCDNISKSGFKFALSNVIENNGQENTILKDWACNYSIHYLNHSYSNSNYQKNRKSTNKEVLITNY